MKNADYEMTFDGEYIHIVHPPGFEITPEGQARLWAELSQACKTNNCLTVLAEGPAPKRQMDPLDAFQSAQQASQSIPGLSMAIVLLGYKGDQITKLFTNAASNRGTRVKFFSSKRTALQWLNVDTTKQDDKPVPTEGARGDG